MPGYSDPGFDTLALHAGAAPDPATGARAVPIHLTTSFVFESSDHAAALFNLERSGPRLFAHQQPDQRGARAADGGAGRRHRRDRHGQRPGGAAPEHRHAHGRGLAHRRQHGAVRRLAEPAALHAAALRHRDHLRQARRPRRLARRDPADTRLLFGETVGNPGLEVLDIPQVAAIAHEAGVPLLVDSTLTSPYLMRPLELGADLVYHSATKFLSGHGTVIGGVVVDGGSFDWDRSGKFAELSAPYDGFHDMVFTEESTVGAFLLRARREGLRDFGACMSPHTAWLILQGIETLPLRMERHMGNTRKVVEFLAAHPFVAQVGHPMLESHPSHALAQRLLPKGAGSVFSFDMKGNREQGKKFIEALKLFSHLANVGDCRSLVIHPASTTHFRMTDEALAAGGITQGTIRLSIGLEDPDDLIDDLKRALKAAEKST